MFTEYLKNIAEKYKTNDYLEHTFRTDFENLLNSFLKEELSPHGGLKVIHEPQREKFGAPDFKIIDKANNIIGYIECKNITEDIKGLVESNQIKKYLEISNNLIFTNYIDFILFKNGEILNHCSIASIFDFKSSGNKGFKPLVNSENQIKDLLRKFFLTTPELTTSTKKLSLELAKRTRILHDFILEEMTSPYIPLDKGDIGGEAGHYYKVYKTFKTMIPELPVDNFVDMYSQIVSFGLLFFRLSKDLILTRENILSNIPHYIPLLKDVFHNARFDKWSGNTLWILDEILLLLNNVDVKIIKESLSYKTLSLLNKREANLSDPFLFFYEEFLKVYDKKTKVSRGVFYTPESVVSFIVRSLDIILKEKLGVKKGFLDDTIKILDFATGTGTFILALIEYIKEELRKTNNYGLFNTEVNEFILENIYGFELLVVPYIICHLRIHEYLESFGFQYKGDKKERAEIYLTNTLENNTNILLTNFFDDIDEEAQLAHKVKNDEEILVIMGNPPYSVSSSNKTDFVENIMKIYKEAVKSERNIQPLSDDYIKFIRFAHWKMEKVSKGVIGIITNNSFLDGIIHRGMREELTKTFDEIYILNLHGNSNIGETCPDGSKDENVFDIKQGVSISFFVKTGKKKNENAGVYYFSLQGLREFKYNFLYENDIKLTHDIQINPRFKSWVNLGEVESPNFWFKKKDLKGEGEYNKFWSVDKIFNEITSGIKTHHDDELVSLFPFKTQTNTYYNYRPFDIRYIDYDLSKVERHRFNIMKHFYNKNNLGLSFVRQLSMNKWQHSFISEILSDICSVSINSKESTYLAPLYLYEDTSPPDALFNNKDSFQKSSPLTAKGGNLDNETNEIKEYTRGVFNRHDLKELRQKLRNNPTKYEQTLWQYINDRQILGVKFRRQHSIGRYIVDFYSPEIKLVIEVDGGQHFTKEGKEYDEERTKFINNFGIKVLRFANNEIENNLESVIDTIESEIKERSQNRVERKPNFTKEFVKYMETKGLGGEAPETILSYIYAILYSPTYRTKYYEFLKIDFPRIPFDIPLTPDLSRGLMQKLSELGQRLIDLHLLKVEFDKNIVSFPVSKPDLNVTKVEYKNNQVWFNDTTYFDNVPQNVWDYYIGGYQVLDKWLKERKKHNYTLCGEDLRHFIKVCNVLAETIEIQGKIDKLTRGWV